MELNSETAAAAGSKEGIGSPSLRRWIALTFVFQCAILFPVANSFGEIRQLRTQPVAITSLRRSLSGFVSDPSHLTASPSSISAMATEKTGTLRVIARRNTDWTVSNSIPWIVITPTSGRGRKQLRYSVSPNADCASRTGTFSINGRNVTIRQASAPKNYSLSATNATFTAEATAGSVGLSADCIWNVQTDADWISTIAPASDNGEGDATIVYAVAANSNTVSRTGSIKIIDGNSMVRQTLSVTQEGVPVSSYSFSPGSAAFPSNAGNGIVQLITSDYAAWTIKAGKGITNVFPTSGIGSASISYSVLPNSTDAPRSTSLSVVDQNSVVQQTFLITIAPVSAPASYSLSSSYLVFTANGGNVSVGLAANAAWTVQSDVNWINNISPASGSGDAVINYSVAANVTSGSRSGTLQILDGNSVVQQTLRITQSGATANFALSSTSENFAATGGSGGVVLTANSSWRILVDVNWITDISPTSGTGDATIYYSISPNTNGASRSSSIRILDGNFMVQKTLLITQDGAPEKYSLVSSNNSPAGYRWSATLGSTGNDAGKSVAADSQGNVLVTGNLDDYIFIEKYSAAGNLLWSKTFYDGNGSGQAIAVDQNDNILVAGKFNSALDLGGGALISAGGYDSFVVKYSPNGTYLWSKQFGGSEGDDEAASVAIDSSGNVLVTGTIVGTVALGGNTTYATGPFDNDIVLAKLSSSNGDFLWAKRFGSTADDNGLSVSVGPQDEVVFTGNFSGPIDFGGGALTSNGRDIFMAKFSSAGAHLWSKQFGGALSDSGKGVAVDSNGNIVLTGAFAGTIDFGGGTLNSANASYDDIFLAKFASDGSHLWSKNFGGTLYDQGNAVSLDSQGNIALSGTFSDAINLGGDTLTSVGGYDIFVAKYSSEGAHLWSKSFGSDAGVDEGSGIAVDRQNNIIGTGRFFSAVDFGGGSQISSGLGDMFMISLAP